MLFRYFRGYLHFNVLSQPVADDGLGFLDAELIVQVFLYMSSDFARELFPFFISYA
jgi:hypothetical protein